MLRLIQSEFQTVLKSLKTEMKTLTFGVLSKR